LCRHRHDEEHGGIEQRMVQRGGALDCQRESAPSRDEKRGGNQHEALAAAS
jgi:hypothetical protein